MAEKIPVDTIDEMLDLLDKGIASESDWHDFVDAITGQGGKWDGFVYPNKNAPTKTVTASVPTGFFNLKPGDKYLFLTRQARLSQNDANDLLAHISDQTPSVPTRYVITEVSPSTVEDWTAKVATIVTSTERFKQPRARISSYKVVALPSTFRSLRTSEKIEFLTKNRSLLPLEANDVVDIVDGRQPRGGSKIEIEWEE